MAQFFTVLLFLTGLWLIWAKMWTKKKTDGSLVFCAQDDDMKIASDTPSAGLRHWTDTGETVAQEYQRHKECGNIFMANRLGEELARPLLQPEDGMFDARDEEGLKQIYFLYGFAVRRAVNRGIHVSILADTVLHCFYETVEDKSPEIYAAIRDSVADTIYRLCLGDDQCIGTGFAKLSGVGGDSRQIELGCETYDRYLSFASGLVKKFIFKP